MKILHLSAYDYGGAGTTSFRLHKKLEASGVDSRMLVLYKRTDDANVMPVCKPGFMSRITRLASKVLLKIRSNPDYYFQDQTRSLLDSSIDYLEAIDFHPDLIVAHWISNFVSVEDLYRMCSKRNIPLVWYLMDMAPLTGGCHYAWDCEGYMNRCGCCPALHSRSVDDLSSRIWKKKHDCLQQMNVTVVAGGWLIDQARKATLLTGAKKEKIMTGVDENVFKPRPRAEARDMLGLPINKKIIFVGSQSMKVRRKGMAHFVEAVKMLENTNELNIEDIAVVTAGDISAKKSLRVTEFEHIHIGFLGEGELIKAYQAADVFVCPSIEDSGPMMVIEAVMCGTPVVAFEMGLSMDMVQTGFTGYLAKLMDSEDLARGIVQVLNLDSTGAKKMSSNCRELGLKLTSDKLYASEFMRLFDEILAECRS